MPEVRAAVITQDYSVHNLWLKGAFECCVIFEETFILLPQVVRGKLDEIKAKCCDVF